MSTPADTVQLLAHRGCLEGPSPARENTRAALAAAAAAGIPVEFDVNLDDGRLTLTHDPAPWCESRDAAPFLAAPGPGLHALNVKRLDALDLILSTLESAGTSDSFFLFDLELLGSDRATMRRTQSRGFHVAYRLSERESSLQEIADDESAAVVWLDEWEDRWVGEHHLRTLAAAGKRTFYVSPELHRPLEPDALRDRWLEVAGWGVTGICTDYPLVLRETLGGHR